MSTSPVSSTIIHANNEAWMIEVLFSKNGQKSQQRDRDGMLMDPTLHR